MSCVSRQLMRLAIPTLPSAKRLPVKRVTRTTPLFLITKLDIVGGEIEPAEDQESENEVVEATEGETETDSTSALFQ